MPLTPYHLGPALLIAVLFYSSLNIVSLFIGSVILDVWPFLVIFFNLNTYTHGISHSLLIAFLVALILALVVWKFSKKKKFKVILLSALIGTFSHILLDSAYEDTFIFWPLLKSNPFAGWYTYNQAVAFCSVCFIIACILIAIKTINARKKVT